MNRAGHWLALVGLLWALGGCATPTPALDQANHTTRLLAMLQAEVAEFDRLHKSAQDSRAQAIIKREARLRELTTLATLDDRARQSAGLQAQAALREKLLSDADTLAEAVAGLARASASGAAALEVRLPALSSTLEPLTEAERKAAEMGMELAAGKRRDELLAFAKEVGKAIKTAREKARQAQESARTASAAVDHAFAIDNATMLSGK